ncbi:MAG: RNA polymerase sigma factor (sigma-70 family) [Cyclobacteriaceae bacterium]|jgi:RNA polymerase sigma factor (sigma-70 family)
MKRDRAKFLQLLDDHQGILHKVAKLYCPDQDSRKDLIQDIIIQLWLSFEKYDPTYKLSTWIYRISLNVAISSYRKFETQKKHIDHVSESVLEHTPQPEHVSSYPEAERLWKFVSQLDDLNKALMILYLEGHSHDEIAVILYISKSNVGTKINRIKDQIKKELTNSNYEN